MRTVVMLYVAKSLSPEHTGSIHMGFVLCNSYGEWVFRRMCHMWKVTKRVHRLLIFPFSWISCTFLSTGKMYQKELLERLKPHFTQSVSQGKWERLQQWTYLQIWICMGTDTDTWPSIKMRKHVRGVPLHKEVLKKVKYAWIAQIEGNSGN